jgi:predicted transcriptional regulator
VPTSIKLPPDLKKRVSAVIEGTEKTAHAFMVEAIDQQTSLAEKRKAFVASALAARRNFVRTGKGYALADVRRYLAARAAGRTARKPRLKRWRG